MLTSMRIFMNNWMAMHAVTIYISSFVSWITKNRSEDMVWFNKQQISNIPIIYLDTIRYPIVRYHTIPYNSKFSFWVITDKNFCGDWMLLFNASLTIFEPFPWQEKLVAPLIANIIGYLQCKDRVTKSEGKKTATGYISDLFA